MSNINSILETTYDAVNVGNGVWMVKRTKLGHSWDECIVYANEAKGMTQEEVIQFAIKRGSWA